MTNRLISPMRLSGWSVAALLLTVFASGWAAETVSITASDNSGKETGADVGVFTISRAASATTALTVYLSWSGTATRGSDYAYTPDSVIIPANQTTVQLMIYPIDDVVAESSETAKATIVVNAAYTIGTPNNATVTILDDEPTMVTITASDKTATEPGSNKGVFTITRTGSAVSGLIIPITISGTAIPGIDYSSNLSSNQLVYIAPNANTTTVTVTPIDDLFPEPSETIIATVGSGTGYTIVGSGAATVTLKDNEKPLVTIAATDAVATETGGNTATFTVSRLGNVSATIPVPYTITGSATVGSDYTTLTGTVSFAANASTALIILSPIDDALMEGSETVTLTLGSSTAYVIGTASSATATITDNEMAVSIVATDAVAREPGTDTGTFTVTRDSTNKSAALSVAYTVSGSASNTSDYTALSGTVTIAANATTATINVTPLNDALVESVENVVVTLTPNAAYAIVGSRQATVQIGDDDAVLPTVSISVSQASVSESAVSVVQFTLTRAGATTAALPINYQISGSATAGIDFTALSGSAIIPINSASVTIPITLINDTVPEATETIIATLLPSASYTIGSPANTTLSINDDDSATVSVSATDATASEPARSTGTGTFTITRSGALASALTIPVSFSGTASVGLDYQASPSTVTLAANVASVTLTVTALDDTQVESDETVVMTLGAGVGYSLAAPFTATVTIQDDEPAVVSLVVTDANASETSGDTAKVNVSRSGRKDTALTIPVVISGTATAGTDYTALAATVTLAANSASTTLTVTAINDALIEVPETVIVTLGAGSGYTLGSPSTATLKIIDDEPSVSLQIVDQYAREGGTPGAIAIIRTGPTTAALPVSLSISGSAVAGTHYNALPSSVTIPIGAVSVVLPVTAKNDSVWRAETMVQVGIASNAAYAIAQPSLATVFMVDNDNLPPNVVVQMLTPDQSSTTLTLDASGTVDPDGDVLTYKWEIYGMGVLSTTAQLAYDYKLLANKTIILTVSDGKYYVLRYYPVLYVNTPTTITDGDTDQDGGVLIVENATLTMNGAHNYLVGRIINNGVITHSACTATSVSSLQLGIEKQLFIDATSKLDVTARGCPKGYRWLSGGPVAQSATMVYSGGSFGGYGYSYSATDITNEVYGTFDNPNEVGSGGGSYSTGSAGGGLIRLTAATLTLNGSLLANGGGDGSSYAGGSGGGIYVNVTNFSGSGTMQARGGGATNGPGGGGRVALLYGSGTVTVGNYSAEGGYYGNRAAPNGSYYYAGAGTVYVKQSGQPTSTLVFDNRFTSPVPNFSTMPKTPWYFGQRGVSGDDPATFVGVIKVIGGSSVAVDTSPTAVTWKNSSVVDLSRLEVRTVSAEAWTHSNQSDVTVSTITAQSLSLAGGSIVRSWPSTATTVESLTINMTGAVTIDATSKLDVTARGCPKGYRWLSGGPVAQSATMVYSGGSFGGYGYSYSATDITNEVYGTFDNPNEVGSGGGSYSTGSAGGGLIRLTAATLTLNGSLLANGGGDGSSYAGGSGGGIYVNVTNFSGSGTMQARGGGATNGPGGGGRIAVYHTTGTVNNGKFSAEGGYYGTRAMPASYSIASAGTIFVQNTTAIYGQLIIDNLGITQVRATPVFSGDIMGVSGSQPVLPVEFTVLARNGGSWAVAGDRHALDSDGDGLVSWEEFTAGTNPRNYDTNSDGLPDGASLSAGINPLHADSDGDGVSNALELQRGTNPLSADTDWDGVLDGVDVFPLDGTQSSWPTPSPTDVTPPIITLDEPKHAITL